MRTDELHEPVDGYILLAEAIVDAAAVEYSYLFPTNAKSQAEFTLLDITKGYASQRESILQGLSRSAVRSIIDYDVCKTAFERRRHIEMRRLGIKWR